MTKIIINFYFLLEKILNITIKFSKISIDVNNNLNVSHSPMVVTEKDAFEDIIILLVRENIWSIIFIVFIVIISLFIILNFISKLLSKLFEKFDFLKLGPIELKGKKTEIKDEFGNKKIVCLDCKEKNKVRMLIDNLKLTSTVEKDRLSIIIDNVIDAIIKQKENYDLSMNSVFENISSSIKKQYYDNLLLLINNQIKLEGDNSNKIMHTREYFFVINLMQNFSNEWKIQLERILRTNGFETFLEDKELMRTYITDLQNCIFFNIDYNMLNLTELELFDIEEVLKECNDNNYKLFEQMLTKLCHTKLSLIKKQKEQIDKIHDNIAKSIDNSINGLIEYNDKLDADENIYKNIDKELNDHL